MIYKLHLLLYSAKETGHSYHFSFGKWRALNKREWPLFLEHNVVIWVCRYAPIQDWSTPGKFWGAWISSCYHSITHVKVAKVQMATLVVTKLLFTFLLIDVITYKLLLIGRNSWQWTTFVVKQSNRPKAKFSVSLEFDITSFKSQQIFFTTS